MLFTETYVGLPADIVPFASTGDAITREIELDDDQAAWEHANKIFDTLDFAASIWDLPCQNGSYSVRIWAYAGEIKHTATFSQNDVRRLKTIYLLEKKRLNPIL